MSLLRRKAPVPVAIAILVGLHLLAAAPQSHPVGPRVVVLGFDGLDPDLLERLMARGELPAFAALARSGGWSRLGTTTPPQSPVAWSTFLTGTGPGRHGVFDFIHRDPATLRLVSSMTRVEPPGHVVSIGDWRLPLEAPAIERVRSGAPFWSRIAEAGHPVLALKVPAEYPPTPGAAAELAGMGVPDLAGTYGEFHYYTDRPAGLDQGTASGRIHVGRALAGRVEASLPGPPNTLRAGSPRLSVPIRVALDPEVPGASVEVGGTTTVLVEGSWSEWIPVEFDAGPLAPSVTGMCRLFLRKVRPWFGLFVSPVHVDPLDPELPISEPDDLCCDLAERIGRYHTKGMPEETGALGAHVLSDAEFLSQVDLVLAEADRLLDAALSDFRGGLLFHYVSSSDLVSHVFWRAIDPGHPAGPADLPAGADPIADVYRRLDRTLARVVERAGPDATVVVLSDHGFAPYRRSFDVNAWLEAEGWLVLRPGAPRDLSGVDWSRTRAYAAGFSGLYVNRAGREGRGIVSPGEFREVRDEIARRLEALIDPATGGRVFHRVDRGEDAFSGDRAAEGPDLVLGYSRGWRTSNGSALGRVGSEVLFDNREAWSGDHLMAAELVPGVLVTNRPLRADRRPSIIDLAPTILAEFGLPADGLEGEDLFVRED